jgi:hypothetical protein
MRGTYTYGTKTTFAGELTPNKSVINACKLLDVINHLGNVQTVINDHITPLSSDGNNIDGYQVGIQSVYVVMGME